VGVVERFMQTFPGREMPPRTMSQIFGGPINAAIGTDSSDGATKWGNSYRHRRGFPDFAPFQGIVLFELDFPALIALAVRSGEQCRN